MSEANNKPKKLAPKAPEREQKPEIAPKKAQALKSDGPTRADYLALEKERNTLREALREHREKLTERNSELSRLQNELRLRAASVDPRWSDGAVLQAFSEAKVGEGPAGAMLVLLEREINQCHEDAEAKERSGDRESVPGYVQAAARLKQLREQIFRLWTEAHESVDGPVSGRRASRFAD